MTGAIRVIQRKNLEHLDETDSDRDRDTQRERYQFQLGEFWVNFMEEEAYECDLKWIGFQYTEL